MKMKNDEVGGRKKKYGYYGVEMKKKKKAKLYY